MVNPQVRVTKTFQTQVTITNSDAFDLTYAKVALMIPGGATYWNTLRIVKVAIWGSSSVSGSETNYLQVTVPSNTSWNTPIAQFTDHGVAGQRRPCIVFQPDLLNVMRAFGTADTTVVCNIRQNGSTENQNVLVIQVTCEIFGPVGAT